MLFFFPTGPQFSSQENGHEDTHHSLRGRCSGLCPEALESSPILSQKSQRRDTRSCPWETGCHGDRSLDNRECGAGWARRCPQAESPKGTSRGRTGAWPRQPLPAAKRAPRPFLSQRAEGGQGRRTSWLRPEGPPRTCWHVLLFLLPRTATRR